MSDEKQKSESYALLGGINSKASPYVNGPMEFRDITNLNFKVPGALTKRMGTSLYVGATVAGRITGLYEYTRLSGASYVVATANTNAYTVTGAGYSAFKAGLTSGALFDFVTFVDRLFAANGAEFFKFDGTTPQNFSLPPGQGSWGVTAVVGGSLTAGVTGTFVFSYGYLNDRGYFGPAADGITITINGVTTNSVQFYGLTTPTGYGVTALCFYRTSAGGVQLTGTTFAPIGTTTATDPGWPLTSRIDNEYLWFTLAPKYLEIYNNQLFMAGFSSLPSTVFASDVGEPEGVLPEVNFEFRTNDGDRVTGLKAYNGSLVVTKKGSVHRLSGGGVTLEDFQAQEITDQYGCLSNRSMVVWENKLWFLDSKGIVEYDGASVRVVSTKVEPIFQTMNVEAAEENAVALHFRDDNELWFALPCNGATLNNCVVVYDYDANAWTKYEGLNVSALALAKGSQIEKTPFYGGYTGTISYFGASLFGDQGQAITCMMDSHFLAARGQTTENLYRRFYLNVNPILGITQAITCNFRQDYGSSIVLTRTMYQNPFQSRIDFGIAARSIQANVIHSSASLPFQIFGFAFESRFQRAV